MSDVLNISPLGSRWQTADPFLFCVHHVDHYPKGNDRLGPSASLAGHNIGQDFNNPDGWSMYHGDVVPGFPQHPHRGFETVTIVRTGYIDHSDSVGATARFGMGDVQWLTAGKGVVHALRETDAVRVHADRDVTIEAVDGPAEILLLQGRPISEPVAQYGPFVMNTRAELEQAFADYQRTQFGGWPFPENAPVFPRTEGRFARHADGRVERVELVQNR
jgi:redox-sensitive bicupin YhaK (pirin superfamily)